MTKGCVGDLWLRASFKFTNLAVRILADLRSWRSSEPSDGNDGSMSVHEGSRVPLATVTRRWSRSNSIASFLRFDSTLATISACILKKGSLSWAYDVHGFGSSSWYCMRPRRMMRWDERLGVEKRLGAEPIPFYTVHNRCCSKPKQALNSNQPFTFVVTPLPGWSKLDHLIGRQVGFLQRVETTWESS